MEYRHELKFLVSNADLELIRRRISHIARLDINQTDASGYLISSLYFDNIRNQCARETIEGYDHRHKYRLRIYDHNPNVIKLERKSKVHGMTAKTSVSMSQAECREMMLGQMPWLQPGYSEKKNRILTEMKLAGMQPKCIVQYRREAFVYPIGNVRITFDQNISGSTDVRDFLSDRINVIPLLNTGVHILEVKYDNLLPRYLWDALEIEKLQQTSFSKYVYARNRLG